MIQTNITLFIVTSVNFQNRFGQHVYDHDRGRPADLKTDFSPSFSFTRKTEQ